MRMATIAEVMGFLSTLITVLFTVCHPLP
jgi:hypothetical protein